MPAGKKFAFLALGMLFIVLAIEVPHWGVQWFHMDDWSSTGQAVTQFILILSSLWAFFAGVLTDV